MANTKQAIKMVRKINRRTQFNRWWKSKVKNAFKSLDESVHTKAASDKLKSDFISLQKNVDKATKKGVFHKNKANRLKSRASKKVYLQVAAQ